MNQSYCLKCKKKCEVKDIEIKKTKNNRSYQQSKCVQCNTKCNKFLPKEKSELNKKVEELVK